MGSNMAFNSTALKTTLAAPILAVAFAASAQVELTCHTTPEAITAVQQKITKDLGMMATTSHFKNVGTDQSPKWAMATLMWNPETKKGYEWGRMPQGHVCISKSYSNVEVFANTKLDARAFLDKKFAPNANDRGDGTNIATMGMNTSLLVKEQAKQYPMYRATVDDIINITKAPLKTPTKYIEYLVSNPDTKEGTILAANFNGKRIAEYTGVVGVPAKDGVKFGAIYAPAIEQMLGLTSSVAALSLDRK
jgi:hypothetical protein